MAASASRDGSRSPNRLEVEFSGSEHVWGGDATIDTSVWMILYRTGHANVNRNTRKV